jgi:hypothetical protein
VNLKQLVEVTNSYSCELGRRLVHLLELKNESMQEMVTDILWALVNLLSVKSGEFAQHFLRSGAIRALTGLIDVKLSSFYSKQHTLLALTIMTNLAAD